MDKDEKKGMKIEIQVDEITAMGQYVNMAIVQHSPSEFVLDFIFLPPGQGKARVRSRVILGPDHLKRFHQILSENLSRYESMFGEIKLKEPPGGMPSPGAPTIQ